MKKSIILFSVIISFAGTSCKKDNWPYCIKANGEIVEETRTLKQFDEIDFNLSGNLHITYDPNVSAPTITIKTSKNIIDRIETEVRDETLHIKDSKCIRKLKDFDAYLTVNDLESVKLNGSGNVYGTNLFSVSEIEFDINGSGNMTFEVDAQETGADINGSGNIILKGVSNDFEVDINGSGNVKAFGLVAQHVYIDINGSGDAEVYAAKTLNVEISGSGNVTYEGTPTVNITNSGSGSVKSK